MGSFKYTELRASARIEALFSRPILDWTGVPSRFNLMVYDALANKVPINPAELSVHGNTVLGEVYAKYNIYGGATSVSLYADKLAFDFPNLIPSDRPLVEQVIASIHDGFPITFPELSYRRMKISSFEHLDLSNANAVDAFLNRFRLPHAESLSSAVVVHPGAKFKAILQDQNWECDFSAERSALSATAVFTALTVIGGVEPTAPFIDKFETMRGAANFCFAVVGLEKTDVSQT